MDITTALTGNIIQAFSWTLIHSTWQGLLLALIAGLILVFTKKVNPNVRYNMLLLILATFLLTVVFTFVYEYKNMQVEVVQYTLNNSHSVKSFGKLNIQSPQVIVLNQPPFYSAQNIKSYINEVGAYFTNHSFFIVLIWLVFFMVKSLSLAGNMLYMHRAKHYRVNDVSIYWNERIASLCKKLKINKRVSLLESSYLKIPVLIGYFKPVILLPIGLIAGLPVGQVEAVLLHELAHIRRNDYIINFFQNIVEAIFFFNPFLLWISARLKEERENCCDDMAISQTNNKEEYIQALISFKEYSDTAPAYATAFSGHKSSVLNRIMRIVYQENKTLSIKENSIFILGIAMLSLMAFTVYPSKHIKDVKPNSLITSTKIGVIRSLPKQTNHSTKKTDVILTKTPPDSIKVSAIHAIDGTGPNFLAIIDDKEYSKDILYHISASCVASQAVFIPEYGLKNYGTKARDGYIKIRTKIGQISYMTAIERENLIAEYTTPKTRFYNRIVLKKEDGSFANDKIVMQVMPAGMVSGYLPHDGRAGFYINKDFYTEETIQQVSPAIIASLTGEYGAEGSDPKEQREKGYALIFKFNTKKSSSVAPANNDTIKYSRVIGEGLGPNPLVLVNGKVYPADLLNKISRSCISGSAVYPSKQAIEKFGDTAKDGCVEIRIKGEIIYLTAYEQRDRVTEAAVPDSKFLTRIQLRDENGKLYDKIIEHDNGATTTMTLAHNAKAAFFVDNKFYTEEQMENLSPEKLNLTSFKGCGVRNLDPQKYGNVNLHNYEVVFFWTNDWTKQKDNKQPTYPYELHLPAD